MSLTAEQPYQQNNDLVHAQSLIANAQVQRHTVSCCACAEQNDAILPVPGCASGMKSVVEMARRLHGMMFPSLCSSCIANTTSCDDGGAGGPPAGSCIDLRPHSGARMKYIRCTRCPSYSCSAGMRLQCRHKAAQNEASLHTSGISPDAYLLRLFPAVGVPDPLFRRKLITRFRGLRAPACARHQRLASGALTRCCPTPRHRPGSPNAGHILQVFTALPGQLSDQP
jgi:hypothetical protein